MAPRTYLKPRIVTDAMETLLKRDQTQPVSYQAVADWLADQGYVSPVSRKPFTRQRVAQILTHPHNKIGQALVAENHRRAANNPNYAGLEGDDGSGPQVSTVEEAAAPAVAAERTARARRRGRGLPARRQRR